MKADIVAPMPIIIAKPNPEALPANLGLIETIPEDALGKVIPLPKPTKNIGPNRVRGPIIGDGIRITCSVGANIVTVHPINIILFIPILTVYFPVKKFPRIYPSPTIVNKYPCWLGVVWKYLSATIGAPVRKL